MILGAKNYQNLLMFPEVVQKIKVAQFFETLLSSFFY